MKHKPYFKHDYYLEEFIQPDRLRKSIAVAVDALKYHRYDSLVFRGTSGLLIGPSVALATGKTMSVVRKETNCHSPYLVEGDAGTKRYIIIDDLVASGKTARVIQEAMKDFAPKAVCLGVLEVARLQYDGKDVGHYSKSYHAQHKAMPLTSVTEVSKERKWEHSYEHCIKGR